MAGEDFWLVGWQVGWRSQRLKFGFEDFENGFQDLSQSSLNNYVNDRDESLKHGNLRPGQALQNNLRQ